MHNFIDILVFWQLAMRYWETSSHFRDLHKETDEDGIQDTSCTRNTTGQEQSFERLLTTKKKSRRVSYLRTCYVIVLIISVFGWGIFDAAYGF